MRVLLLPNNIASIPASTALALNEKPGVEARCFVYATHKYQKVNNLVIARPSTSSHRNPFKWLYTKLSYRATLFRWIRWADILHYAWGPALPDGADLRYAKKLGKKIFVEWMGSDIRNPDLLSKRNPFYKAALEEGYEYKGLETPANSLKHQQEFATVGAIPLYWPEMKMFIRDDLFPRSYPTTQRINLSEFVPCYPALSNRKPLVVHSPSAVVCKGSKHIAKALENLKGRYDFEYRQLHNMPREEVLSVMSQADIFIDQVIIGAFGMAAMEAMAFGKPTVAYLLPDLFRNGLSAECPIVNANPVTLEEELEKLLADASLRHELGKRARAYVEGHHEIGHVCEQLRQVYNSA